MLFSAPGVRPNSPSTTTSVSSSSVFDGSVFERMVERSSSRLENAGSNSRAQLVMIVGNRAVPDVDVMVPAGMADVDVVRAGVLRQHIARQHAGDADRSVAVALAVRLGDLECGGPAAVGEQLVGGIVEILVARHLAAVRGEADALGLAQLA